MTTAPSPILPIGFDEATLQQLTAGLTEQQLLWLSGYLYGRAAAGQPAPATQSGVVASVNAPAGPAQLTILYGSQTGNSKKAANITAEIARQKGLSATVRDMNDYPTKDLKTEQQLLVVVSTQGEGDPPIAAEELHQFLLSARAPKLPELQYAVLALGDKSYLQFCQTGFEFDQRLAELGGKRLLERVDCDVEFEDETRKWAAQVLEVLAKSVPAAVPAPVAVAAATITVPAVLAGGLAAPAAVAYTSRNPFSAPLLEKIQLNGRGSTKETYHLEFSLEGSGIQYEAGDALMVQPTNRPALVEEVLQVAHLNASAPVRLESTELDLTSALTEHLELSVVTRDVLERYASLAPQHGRLREILADRAQLPSYLYGRDVADLLTEFPVELSGQQLAAVLRPLPARAYSIASSLLAHPEEVHLTVGAVRYQAYGRDKHGACSVYQADHLNLGDTARVWVDRNEYFKLPQDSATDIIMVGAGTGVAPFRAFVEERAETGAAGRNWLVFGNPHFTTDFLYQTQWQQHLKKGTLDRLDVAFSRDQEEKVYIQHRLLEQGRRLYDQLENGAYFYVCGDKTRMAADVQRALLTIIGQESGLGEEYAAEYLKKLKKARRFLEDVY